MCEKSGKLPNKKKLVLKAFCVRLFVINRRFLPFSVVLIKLTNENEKERREFLGWITLKLILEEHVLLHLCQNFHQIFGLGCVEWKRLEKVKLKTCILFFARIFYEMLGIKRLSLWNGIESEHESRRCLLSALEYS